MSCIDHWFFEPRSHEGTEEHKGFLEQTQKNIKNFVPLRALVTPWFKNYLLRWLTDFPDLVI